MLFSAILTLAAVGVATAQTCGPAGGQVAIAGSSTVEPIARAWAAKYMEKCPTINVAVQGGGSSIGAGRVCANPMRGTPVDIGCMSRKWAVTEATSVDGNNNNQCLIGDPTRKTIQIKVGINSIAIAVLVGRAAAQCLQKMPGLTTAQLRWMFSNFTQAQMGLTAVNTSEVIPNSDGNMTSRNWNELNSGCPYRNIRIAGPDALSGTNEFFRDALKFMPSEGFKVRRPGGYFNSPSEYVISYYLELSSPDFPGDAIAYMSLKHFLETDSFWKPGSCNAPTPC
jgi:ABC-type phosphate transport system substrate-binding protein